MASSLYTAAILRAVSTASALAASLPATNTDCVWKFACFFASKLDPTQQELQGGQRRRRVKGKVEGGTGGGEGSCVGNPGAGHVPKVIPCERERGLEGDGIQATYEWSMDSVVDSSQHTVRSTR